MSKTDRHKDDFSILGGGVAGLAFGHFAKKNNLKFSIYEYAKTAGGLSRTFERNGFRFDSSAHRFHSKYAEVTELIKGFLKDDLKKIRLPTQLFYNGSLIDFPPTPLNLFKKLGPVKIVQALFEIIVSKFKKSKNTSFEDVTVALYGRTVASLFLLNYTKKLWGAECADLLPEIAGVRLVGMNLKTFIVEAIFGHKAKVQHIEGSFYYPKFGIGMIPDALVAKCGVENVHTSSPITSVNHKDGIVTSIEVNGTDTVEVDKVVNTMPITTLVKLFNPAPSKEIMEVVSKIDFRSLRVVAIFLDRESVTIAATITFPDENVLFTRMYEPKNRSSFMAPEGKTSVLLEVPCDVNDEVWNMPDAELIDKVTKDLIDMKFIKKSEIIDSTVFSIKEAYPKLKLSTADEVKIIRTYIDSFKNLYTLGRNGNFNYSHIHHQIRWAKELVEKYVASLL